MRRGKGRVRSTIASHSTLSLLSHARRAAGGVLPRVCLVGLLGAATLQPRPAGAQVGLGGEGLVGEQGAIPVRERFDPLTDSYRTVVLTPLPLDAVRAIQSALRAQGYDAGPPSGTLDSRTRAALRSFQADRGLRISGHPDYETVLALGLPVRRSAVTYLPPREPRRPARRRAAVVLFLPDSTRIFVPGVIGVMPGPVQPPPAPPDGAPAPDDPPRAPRDERDEPARGPRDEVDERGRERAGSGGEAAAPAQPVRRRTGSLAPPLPTPPAS